MTEAQQKAEQYAIGKSSSSVFRQAHIDDFLAGWKERERSGWVETKKQLPIMTDANEDGYVLVSLRKDRQWGRGNRIGFIKWNRVKSERHTHWAKAPQPPKPITPEGVK